MARSSLRLHLHIHRQHRRGEEDGKHAEQYVSSLHGKGCTKREREEEREHQHHHTHEQDDLEENTYRAVVQSPPSCCPRARSRGNVMCLGWVASRLVVSPRCSHAHSSRVVCC